MTAATAPTSVPASARPRHLLDFADWTPERLNAILDNADTLLQVLDRPVKTGRIQRATVQAWDADAVPLVVLTKADLVPDDEARAAEVSDAATLLAQAKA